MHRFRERARVSEVRRRRLPPQQIGVAREGEAALDAVGQPGTGLEAEEAFGRALAGDEFAVALVDVGGDELRALGVGARHHQRGDAGHVGGEPRRGQVALMRGGRDQNLAAEMAALLLGCELVLEMHAGGARLDERLHDLEGVERAAEAGFRVGEDRREPVALGAALRVLDLVGARQGAIDAAAELRTRVSGVEALIGIDRSGRVAVGRNLPAGEVDRLQPGADHLHGLVAGHGAERRDVGLGLEKLPQTVGAALRERVTDGNGAAQALDFFGAIGPLDAVETADRGARDHAVKS